MKLTNEEIAKVFAMYWGSEITTKSDTNKKRTITGACFNALGDLLISTDNGNYGAKYWDTKIVLNLLSFITDEHAIEVANLFCKMSGDGIGTLTHCVRTVDEVRRDDPWKVTIKYDTGESLSLFTDTGEVVFHTKFTEQIFLLGKYTYEPRELLIKNRYAVPLFFGVDHWANGKTAIELKIAKTP